MNKVIDLSNAKEEKITSIEPDKHDQVDKFLEPLIKDNEKTLEYYRNFDLEKDTIPSPLKSKYDVLGDLVSISNNENEKVFGEVVARKFSVDQETGWKIYKQAKEAYKEGIAETTEELNFKVDSIEKLLGYELVDFKEKGEILVLRQSNFYRGLREYYNYKNQGYLDAEAATIFDDNNESPCIILQSDFKKEPLEESEIPRVKLNVNKGHALTHEIMHAITKKKIYEYTDRDNKQLFVSRGFKILSENSPVVSKSLDEGTATFLTRIYEISANQKNSDLNKQQLVQETINSLESPISLASHPYNKKALMVGKITRIIGFDKLTELYLNSDVNGLIRALKTSLDRDTFNNFVETMELGEWCKNPASEL